MSWTTTTSVMLENRMREAFPLEGTPIRLKFKKKD